MNKIELEAGKHYVEIQDDGSVALVYTNGMITNCITNSMAEVLKAFVKELQEARDRVVLLEAAVGDLGGGVI